MRDAQTGALDYVIAWKSNRIGKSAFTHHHSAVSKCALGSLLRKTTIYAVGAAAASWLPLEGKLSSVCETDEVVKFHGVSRLMAPPHPASGLRETPDATFHLAANAVPGPRRKSSARETARLEEIAALLHPPPAAQSRNSPRGGGGFGARGPSRAAGPYNQDKTPMTKQLPCFVALLAKISPLFAAESTSPDTNSPRESNELSYLISVLQKDFCFFKKRLTNISAHVIF